MPNARRGGPHERWALNVRVRVEREAAGLTQEQLAELVGRSPSWVSRAESGDVGIPGEFVPTIARALGITVSRLYGELHPSQALFAKAS